MKIVQRTANTRSTILLVIGLLLSCTDGLGPAADVQGTWDAEFNIPGAALVLDLSQSDSTVTGSGTYAIEAGRSGTVQEIGNYSRPAISLRITYDYGRAETFTGTVLNPQHMVGTVSDSAGHTSALSFTRR